MILFQDVSKQYPKTGFALKNVSFHLRRC